MGTKPANKKSKKSTQEAPPENPPVPWTFTKKFLPELFEGPYHRDREAMLAWLRDLQSPLRDFCHMELSGARYKQLGKILTNDEENWLRQVPQMVENAMTFSADDIAARKAAGFETGEPASDRDMHIVSLMRRICDSDGMPIPPIVTRRLRAATERARLRHSVAYRLLLKTISDLQQVPNGDFQSAIGTSGLQKWPDVIGSSSKSSSPATEETSASSQKRGSSRSPTRSPTSRREPKKRKNAAATLNQSPAQPQLQQEPERAAPASSRRSNASDPGAVELNDENDSAPGSLENVENLMEESLTTTLRAALRKEEQLRKEAEAKVTAVREAIAALEMAVEKVKAAVQVA